MKKIKKLPLVISPLFALSLTGCFTFKPSGSSVNSSSNNSSEESSTPTSYSEPTTQPEEAALKNSPEYLNFWNPNTEISLSITMSSEAASFMNNYQTNHNDSTYMDYYVPCNVTFTINGNPLTLEEVGIRVKGNLSRQQFLSGGHFNSGTLSHFKLSFKETFDGKEYTNVSQLTSFKKTWESDALKTERKNRTLFDMEKIDIKWNRNDDQTNSKQAYAYKTFRENGVMASHDTLARTSLAVNGDTPITATYEVLECIDKVFVKRYFSAEKADGDLYKCTYTSAPANFSPSYTVGQEIGVEDNVSSFHPAYDLKTNKKKNTTHTSLLNLMNVMNNNSLSASEFKTQIEQVMDMNSFLMYESIAYLMGNYDDFRNNMNNYYLYITSSTSVAYIIPYDFDRCLGAGCDGIQDYMTNFSPESTKMQCSHNWQATNIFWRTVCKSSDSASGHHNVEQVESYRAQYQKNIEDLLNNGSVSPSSFTSYVNAFPSSVRGNPNGSGYNNTTFSNYFNKKVTIIKQYYNGVNI